MLKDCRTFYRLYPQIRPSAVGELPEGSFSQTRQSLIGESATPELTAPAVQKSLSQPGPISPAMVLRLSWTHLLEIIRLDDPWKRAFYENECLKGNGSVRQLQRQIGSLLYERTGLSTDKQAVIEHARQQAAAAPVDIASLIRDPYVLEFTGLAAQPRYLETDLETALLDHLPGRIMISNPICLRVKGPFRDATAPCATENHVLPAFLEMVFDAR